MRRWLVIGSAAVALLLVAAVVVSTVLERRRVVTLAARLLPSCAPGQIHFVSGMSGDTFEQYELEACGKPVTLWCMAPDFECFVRP